LTIFPSLAAPKRLLLAGLLLVKEGLGELHLIVPRGTINIYFFFKFPRIFRLKGVIE